MVQHGFELNRARDRWSAAAISGQTHSVYVLVTKQSDNRVVALAINYGWSPLITAQTINVAQSLAGCCRGLGSPQNTYLSTICAAIELKLSQGGIENPAAGHHCRCFFTHPSAVNAS